MSQIDLVKQGMAAWSAGDLATLGALLTDDFALVGAAPMPVNKEQFLGLDQASISAMPDWSFNARDWQESGNTVTVTVQITGTHTGTMPSVIPGVPDVPATGTHVQQAVEHQTYTFRGDKLASLSTDAAANGGGLPDFYRQIGVQLPPMP